MSCNCGCQSSFPTPCTRVTNCPAFCTAMTITNSWTVPACAAEAVLSIPGLKTVVVGTFLTIPGYGIFEITGFNSINSQVTVRNNCNDGNATPGTPVPAYSVAVLSANAGQTNITYSAYSGGTNYTLTTSNAPMTFSSSNPSITLGIPGKYLLLANFTIGGNNVTTGVQVEIQAGMTRQNNTPTSLGLYDVLSVPPQTAFVGNYGVTQLLPLIYTTANSNDIITINGLRVGAVVSGSFEVGNAGIVAVKLS